MDMFYKQRASLYGSFENAESLIAHNTSLARRCGEVLCEYCERLGQVKKTYHKTKAMLTEMVEGIGPQTLPRMFFPRHIRPEFGNYQAYILRNGIYVNVWKFGGHKNAIESLCEEGKRGAVKVHARKRSDIQFSNREESPTEEQIEVIREIIIDSTEVLWFSFCYDINHPDPRFINEIPF